MNRRTTFFALALLPMLVFATLATAQQRSDNTRHTVLNSSSGGALLVGQGGGVGFDQSHRLLDIDKLVGEEVCFTLTAKDQNGNVIRSWNVNGNPTTITLKGSDANTDSSTRSWNADPDGYSWARLTHNGTPLTQVGPNEWSIPNTDFDSLGQARICLTHSKALKGVTLMVTPFFSGLNQETEKMNFTEIGQTNYLVEITSHVPGKSAVYHMRQYELTVTPRDRYLNVTNVEMATKFSARWPGEFDNTIPGLADIFAGEVFIKGPTPYLVASRIIRELPGDILQYIVAYASSDPTINGRTNDYEILSHEPVDFVLLTPPDHTFLSIDVNNEKTPMDFTWTKPFPSDPYFQIKTSNSSSAVYSDTVAYTLVFIDSTSLTFSQRYPSNNVGTEPKLTMLYQQIRDVANRMAGRTNWRNYNLVWYVEATDGLYVTKSGPPANDPSNRPGFYLTLGIPVGTAPVAAPARLGLSQNYPNPFNPSTSIRFSIPTTGRVQLRVFDLLGAHVGTLVDEVREAGEYSASFDASSLPTGIYVYKLQFEGKTLTRRMTLMK